MRSLDLLTFPVKIWEDAGKCLTPILTEVHKQLAFNPKPRNTGCKHTYAHVSGRKDAELHLTYRQ